MAVAPFYYPRGVDRFLESVLQYLMRMTSRTWSSNLGLFFAAVLGIILVMTLTLLSLTPNSSRIRPKNWAFLLKDPFFGPNSR